MYTARDLREKRLQKALLLYWDPEHWPLAREALEQAGRRDLIGRRPAVPGAARVTRRAPPRPRLNASRK